MLKLTQDPFVCSRCGHTYLVRHQRSWWMKWLGVERHLRCGNCRQTLLFRPKMKVEEDKIPPPPANN